MSATVIAFPGCAAQLPVPAREPEPESVVFADLVEQLTEAASRLPFDSRWRAWALRHANTLNLVLGVRGGR
jgi:hypothetical protein